MNAHGDLSPQIPAIVKALPNPIDQLKLFELIQIIPSPTKSALRLFLRVSTCRSRKRQSELRLVRIAYVIGAAAAVGLANSRQSQDRLSARHGDGCSGDVT